MIFQLKIFIFIENLGKNLYLIILNFFLIFFKYNYNITIKLYIYNFKYKYLKKKK